MTTTTTDAMDTVTKVTYRFEFMKNAGEGWQTFRSQAASDATPASMERALNAMRIAQRSWREGRMRDGSSTAPVPRNRILKVVEVEGLLEEVVE